MVDALAKYKAKRNFAITPEPLHGGVSETGVLSFVVQKHWASHLHYDFRLELEGTMKSWAVPKGPSLDPKDKRMAVQVEDHPIAYNQFEGEIPAGQYGAGKVIIWDEGHWVPLGDPVKGYRDGSLKFDMHGHKLQGRWALVRMKGKSEKQIPWLLIKEKDGFARTAAEFSVVDEMPDSVVPLRSRRIEKSANGAKVAAPTTSLPGASDALPATLRPQLAVLMEAVPSNPTDWLFEIKFDGYRLLTRIEGKTVQLFTRNGNDWTHKLPKLAQSLGQLGLKSAWLDGEIAVTNDKDIPDFQRLQNAFDRGSTDDILYYLFDVPYLDGRDLRQEALETRRAVLQQLFNDKTPDNLRFSDTFDVRAQDLLSTVCKMGLEGVIGKKKNAVYVSRRSDSWIKLKCRLRQEFVVVGYTDPKGSRVGLGSLLLGVHDDKGLLQYAGNVGTGFDGRTLLQLKQKLETVAARTSPLACKTDLDGTAHWVQPVLLAEVSFGEWTDTQRIRHAVFHGLRADKAPESITRENPTSISTSEPQPVSLSPRLKITHPERVIDSSTGLTKLELVRFYNLVAPLLLPHLKHRPVSMVRAPAGIDGELFFQKHLEGKMPGVKLLDPVLDPGHAPLMEVATLHALLSAAQMNVVEFHTWNGVKTAIHKPDRMTFDLDPGEGVEWKTMQQGAELVHQFLQQLGLASFVKTSGGKGLHIVVALKKYYHWDAVKAFSQTVVQHLAHTLPQLFVAKSGPKNRIGKIFVDYLRNGFGATTVTAWSARARPGMGVSVPILWDEVSEISGSAHWTIANIHTRLDLGNGPWKNYAPQNLGNAMKLLDFDPPKAE
ncbi:ATP-dependent DNA ligase LigD phosphoesterase module/ATP-dependent DNA ligase LigD polymerase module [Rhodoferax sp. OV413]|uniref:DNA ligase D n=1 Tax=Rhodoferax sp. OV413 TaxID=1855285 RepID=UPI00088440C3|nr:DNA ligase D [Rhodoferax sp. OV413]SDO96978.1 ATP-dependent DNA ligase LigD phosphoesterase module/ATP-dependent DNA ligase LigD polymerase module [Rhodoferax sp. OV413]